jgi:hypothetical protein
MVDHVGIADHSGRNNFTWRRDRSKIEDINGIIQMLDDLVTDINWKCELVALGSPGTALRSNSMWIPSRASATIPGVEGDSAYQDGRNCKADVC